jgi:hypothetical protein
MIGLKQAPTIDEVRTSPKIGYQIAFPAEVAACRSLVDTAKDFQALRQSK